MILSELGYFKLAKKFKITDKPNLRSSHKEVTILGGGIIFYVSMLLFWVFNGFEYTLFFAGLSFIAAVSFFDDIRPQSFRVRLLAQLIAVLLMIAELGILASPFLWYAAIGAVLSVSILNAYNFMDGINGMLGMFSILLGLSLLYINHYVIEFVDKNLIIYLILGLIVFGFFNFRKTAKCFSGDVGSISMGFISIFLVGLLMRETQSFIWIGLLTIFGIDSGMTLAHRVYLRENVTLPHRKHLFQLMVNELRIIPPIVSAIYAAFQLVLTVGLIALYNYPLYAWIFLGVYTIAVLGLYMYFHSKIYSLHQPKKSFETLQNETD